MANGSYIRLWYGHVLCIMHASKPAAQRVQTFICIVHIAFELFYENGVRPIIQQHHRIE